MDDAFPSEWDARPVADCMSAIIDYRGKTPKKSPVGIPLITAKIVKGGRILDVSEFIPPEDYDSWMRRGLPEPGDIVVTTEAPLGEVAQLDGRKVALAQRIVTLRGEYGVLDNDYLKFAMQSAFVQGQLLARATGTTVVGIKQRELRQVLIPLPPIEEQRAIALVLGSLDDKIELNRRMNRTLEQMAAAIFKAWFVDFEPVRAKASGAASFPGMPQPVFDALPATFADSELGPIPEGWNLKPLKDATCLTMGQSPKSEFYNTTGDGLPFHQGVTNYGERFPVHKTYCTVEKRVAEPGDILFSVRAPVGRINVADERLIVGRGLAAIRHNQDWQSFMLYALKHQFAEEDSIGDGTIFTAVTKKDMEGIRIVEPTEAIGIGYEKLASAIDQQIGLNDRESRTLTETRDALLPKLLSGEVRVNPEQ